MIYLSTFNFPTTKEVDAYLASENYTLYPWNIFFYNLLSEITFKDITILYGNNGSGKTTILNIIADRIKASKKIPNIDDAIYDDYGRIHHPYNDFLAATSFSLAYDDLGNKLNLPLESKMITSNDIFQTIKERNEFNAKRIKKWEELKIKRREILKSGNPFKSSKDLDSLKEYLAYKRQTEQKFLESNVKASKKMLSNGEEAIRIYEDLILENGLYLLDEPENCLSSKYQLKLIQLICDAVRYFHCQFIISSHSPLILGLTNARIYNLDSSPVTLAKWYELENVKIYYDFFKKNKNKFEK